MISKNKEKSCKNCRYYAQHYIKGDTRYNKARCGHCDNRNNKKREAVLCGLWEDINIRKQKRKKAVKEMLALMAEHLADIMMILKDDKEE